MRIGKAIQAVIAGSSLAVMCLSFVALSPGHAIATCDTNHTVIGAIGPTEAPNTIFGAHAYLNTAPIGNECYEVSA